MKKIRSLPGMFVLVALLANLLAYPAQAQAQGEGPTEPCIARNGLFLSMPNGDNINVFCPVTGGTSLFRVFDSVLPEGYTYGSALALYIIQNKKAIPVITEGGYIKVSFVVGTLQPGSSYTVLYWDNESSSWIPLKDFLRDENGVPRTFALLPGTDDARRIVSGVQLVSRDGVLRVEVSVNFPGIFVLAQY